MQIKRIEKKASHLDDFGSAFGFSSDFMSSISCDTFITRTVKKETSINKIKNIIPVTTIAFIGM